MSGGLGAALDRVEPRPAGRSGLAALVTVRAPEMARQGLRQLGAYRLRTALALTGVVVGVTAVVGSMTLIGGVEKMVLSSFERLFGGDRAGFVRPLRERWQGGKTIAFQKVFAITPEDRLALQAAVPEIEHLAPTSFGFETVATGRLRIEGIRVTGATPDFFAIRRFPLGAGRMLDQNDERERARVVLLAEPLAVDLFSRPDPVGQDVIIGGQVFRVVGTIRALGGGASRNWWRQAFVPYETSVARLGRTGPENSVWVKLRPGARFADLQDSLVRVLVARHPGSVGDQFRAFAPGRWQEGTLKSIAAQGRMLTTVAMLCLLAGGVGIMNVFLIAVTERTREIGLRIALGATRRGVMAQILFEACLLCLAGGLTGIALGRAVAGGLSGVVRRELTEGFIDPALLDMHLSRSAVLAGLGLALLVGIVCGSYPAWRASRLDPAESLLREG